MPQPSLPPLPIDPFLPEIREHLARRRAVVITAPPGAGKTTRVPAALAEAGPVVLLEPRRLAARSIARRIAEEQSWTLGEEVGWQVRFDRRFGPHTRLLVATEGILTARLQADPLLGGFRTVVLDEFHERSVHADLALALAREAWRAREDLCLVVMSATLDAGAVARYLDDCPVVAASGRQYPVEISYRPDLDMRAAIREALATDTGHVLCFLPGAPEIRRMAGELAAPRVLPSAAVVLPLHGSLSPEEQDRALAPLAGGGRKVILATNVAETSLTVEGVVTVVDGGFHKLLRRDPATGVDRLSLERISRDAADQRAGRAGRTGPGRALRLWDSRQELRPAREPEIARVDLAAPFLEVFAWGGDPASFGWFEPPPREAASAALSLLELLGATAGGRLTALGERLRRLPLHPRLGRLLLAAATGNREDLRAAAAACAILGEGWGPPAAEHSTRSDLLSAADRIASAPSAVRAAARDLEREAARTESLGSGEGTGRPDAFLRAVLAAFPDRVARRRAPGSRRLLLQSGTGAELGRDSLVSSEFLVAVDLAQSGGAAEPMVRMASAVESEWLRADRHEIVHWLDENGVVRAAERGFYGALPLGERGLSPDPERSRALLAEALAVRPLSAGNEQLVRRMRRAGMSVDLRGLLERVCAGRTALPAADQVNLERLLPAGEARRLQRAAPTDLPLPSGRRAQLEYREDGAVVAAVKLQELFGLAETPRVGEPEIEVTLELLAPNGRPVQTTRDLRSFWQRTYPEVRKELRGRYPRHPWPEDPWTAQPSHRPKPRPPRKTV